MVNNFDNSAEPPPDMESSFYQLGYLTKDKTTYEEILAEGHADPVQVFLERSCAFNTMPSLLGECTNYKKQLSRCNYRLDAHESLQLGLLCSKLVDAAKQGDVLTRTSWTKMKRTIESKKREMPKSSEENIVLYLEDFIRKKVQESLAAVREEAETGNNNTYDKDLTILADEFEHRSPSDKTLQSDYMKLKEEITAVNSAWKRAWGANKQKKPGSAQFQSTVLECYAAWRGILPSEGILAANKNALPDIGLMDPEFGAWALLKASVTYKCFSYGPATFSWWVCGRQLAFIKAIKVGLSPLSSAMAVILKPGRAALVADEEYDGEGLKVEGTTDNDDETDDYGSEIGWDTDE